VLVLTAPPLGESQLSFDEKGTPKVYIKSGKLVNTFPTPANWEGTLENRTIVPGFYIIELNSTHYKVTVIK
jgi:hypothetical protein